MHFENSQLTIELSKDQLFVETFVRRTISFYRYFKIANPQEFKDLIYQVWTDLNCLGRILIANEIINAQMNIPEQ